MKNNKLNIIVLCAINFVVCLCLLSFLTPDKIALLSNFNDKIIVVASKWWLIIGIVLPVIFLIINLISKNKELKFLMFELTIFLVYENMLGYSYFCSTSSFVVGDLSKIPLSVAVFLPLSLFVFVYGAIIKNISYKNKLGIISKNTTTTEFIWKQSHITASYHYMLSGFILFIVSIAFIFIHQAIIEFAIFVLGLIIPRIIVEIQAKQMTEKFNDMKKKQEFLKSKQGEKNEK